MKPHFVMLLGTGLSFLVAPIFSQTPKTLDTTVYTIVETSPEFPGGSDALKEYMQKHVIYPVRAQKAHIRDRIFVSFIVELDGNLTNTTVLQGLGYGCDEEAVRVIRTMPHWIPGSQSGKPIRVKYKLPVLFGIDYAKSKKY